MTVQREGIRGDTCMVFSCLYLIACLYLIFGSFLRAGRATPSMAAGFRDAAHPLMSARKTPLCTSVHAASTQPGRAQAAPLFAAWDTRE